MAAPISINSYADVQSVLSALVSANGLPIASAPHGVFWQTLTYKQFVTGTIPGVSGNYKIVIPGNAAGSNIIMALSGTPGSPFDPNTGIIGQMPQPNPPYNSSFPKQADVIAALSVWINNGCPENSRAPGGKSGTKPAGKAPGKPGGAPKSPPKPPKAPA
jgi:hypothetical protein